MEIRLSSPDALFEFTIAKAAKAAKCYCRVKWATPTQVRFELVAFPSSTTSATIAQPDDVIRELFSHDPLAIIRTARAIYEGAIDYETQFKARQSHVL